MRNHNQESPEKYSSNYENSKVRPNLYSKTEDLNRSNKLWKIKKKLIRFNFNILDSCFYNDNIQIIDEFSDNQRGFRLIYKKQVDSCTDKSLEFEIYKPIDCKSSYNRNEISFYSLKFNLDIEKNFMLKNLNLRKIKYGTNYLINFLILTKSNDVYEELKNNLTTSIHSEIFH